MQKLLESAKRGKNYGSLQSFDRDSFGDLTDDLWLKIFGFLDPTSLVFVERVSKQFFTLSRAPTLWVAFWNAKKGRKRISARFAARSSQIEDIARDLIVADLKARKEASQLMKLTMANQRQEREIEQAHRWQKQLTSLLDGLTFVLLTLGVGLLAFKLDDASSNYTWQNIGRLFVLSFVIPMVFCLSTILHALLSLVDHSTSTKFFAKIGSPVLPFLFMEPFSRLIRPKFVKWFRVFHCTNYFLFSVPAILVILKATGGLDGGLSFLEPFSYFDLALPAIASIGLSTLIPPFLLDKKSRLAKFGMFMFLCGITIPFCAFLWLLSSRLSGSSDLSYFYIFSFLWGSEGFLGALTFLPGVLAGLWLCGDNEGLEANNATNLFGTHCFEFCFWTCLSSCGTGLLVVPHILWQLMLVRILTGQSDMAYTTALVPFFLGLAVLLCLFLANVKFNNRRTAERSQYLSLNSNEV